MPPIHMPFFLEAATLSRIRSPVTSRSNWAKDKRTFRGSRPMLVVVLNCWVIDTNETPRRRIWGPDVLPWGTLSDSSEPHLPRRDAPQRQFLSRRTAGDCRQAAVGRCPGRAGRKPGRADNG